MRCCARIDRNALRAPSVALALALTAPVFAGVDDPIFYPQVHRTGDDPRILGAPDVNGDGLADLVTWDVDGGTITALLGDGAGGFSQRVTSDEGSNGWATLADATGDGRPDVIALGGSGVTVYAGDGAGAFVEVADLDAGDVSNWVAAGDYDGDGIVDLLVTDSPESPIVIPGLGGGAFGAPIELGFVARSHELAAADLDGDTIPELLNLDSDGGTLEVYPGLGGGAFGPPTVHDLGLQDYAGGLTAVDLDNDGDLDIVAGETNCSNEAVFVAVLLGDGVGGLGAAAHYPGLSSTDRIVVRDFDRDGVLDIAASGCGGFRALIGAGDGTFTPVDDGFTLVVEDAVALADFDGDGMDELARRHEHGVSILDGPGDGTFVPEQVLLADYDGYPDNALITDMNADGLPDIVSVGYQVYEVFLGDGEGGFMHDEFRFSPGPLTLADFNSDSVPDVAFHTIVPGPEFYEQGIRVLLRAPDGSAEYAGPGDSLGPYSDAVWALESADLDGDGHADLAVIVETIEHEQEFGVLIGQGDGTFGPVEWISEARPPLTIIGDANDDGGRDFLVARPDDEAEFWLCYGVDGAGAVLCAEVGYPEELGGVVSFDAADLNGDGVLDVAFALEDAGSVFIQYGYIDEDRGPRFHPVEQLTALDLPGSGRPAMVRLADLDADGAIDIIVGRDGLIEVLRGNGEGYFSHAGFYPGTERDRDLRGVGVGDLDGDGRVELAVGAYISHVRLLRNVSGQATSCTPDFTGDGMLDFTDVLAFVGAFAASDPSADLAEPFGAFDFLDVFVFLGQFASGCPSAGPAVSAD